MNLFKALQQADSKSSAPIYGKDGYAGEQDGSYVVDIGIFRCARKSVLKNATLPKGWRVNWVRKFRCPVDGNYIKFSLYTWSNSECSETQEKEFLECLRAKGVQFMSMSNRVQFMSMW